MGAERDSSEYVSPTCDNASEPVAVGPAPLLASATQCPQRGALRASTMPPDGSVPSFFYPARKYSSGNFVLFRKPVTFFS